MNAVLKKDDFFIWMLNGAEGSHTAQQDLRNTVGCYTATTCADGNSITCWKQA